MTNATYERKFLFGLVVPLVKVKDDVVDIRGMKQQAERSHLEFQA